MNDDLLLSSRLYVLEVLLLQNKLINQEHYFRVLDQFAQNLPDLSLVEEPQNTEKELHQLGDLIEKIQAHKDNLKRALNQSND